MASPASEPADAATKLRLVLDYLPCEACLAAPVRDQELLCSICARVHRQVGVRVARRTSVIVERPPEPEPVVIPPARAPDILLEEIPDDAPVDEPEEVAPAPALDERPEAEVAVEAPAEPEGPPPVEVLLWDGKRRSGRPGRATEVVVEPYAPPPPPPAYVDVAEAEVSVARAPEEAPEDGFGVAAEAEPFEAEDGFGFEKAAPAAADDEWEDVATFTPPAAPRAPPAPEPARAAEIPEDDFVFRPPAQDDEAARAEPEPDVDWSAAREEEVPVEPPEGERSPWAPPGVEAADVAFRDTDFLAEEARAEAAPAAEPAPAWAPPPEPEDEVLETEIVDTELVDEPPVAIEDEEILETSIVDEPPAAEAEEILETEIVEAEIVAEEAASDLLRLRGLDASHLEALRAERIESLSHLSGHDPHELAEKTGLPADLVVAWVQAADLVHEVGVPIDAAVALVAAGVAGPRGLAEMEAEAIADRVAAFGNAAVSARDIKRWKRRA